MLSIATLYGKIKSCYVSTTDTRENGVIAFRWIYFQLPFEKPSYKAQRTNCKANGHMVYSLHYDSKFSNNSGTLTLTRYALFLALIN